MDDVALGPGSLIDGKFELTAKLGEGGMGSVWRAEHRTLNAPVAVKLLDPGIAKTEEGLARFLREAQAAAALRGTHVVQTFDYGLHGTVPYIVMELLVGESLGERIARVGPLPPGQVATLLKQVARAVTKAHQAGIVHRDLKPENIFLVESDGDEFTAKVLDFGIAKAADSLGSSTSSKTRTGALLGTPYYMSPEQAQGTKEVDFRSDLWALAVITFEALTGRRPFDSEALGDLLLKICAEPLPVPSQVASVPAGFDTWFARAAARDPGERFASALEMAKAFELMLDPTRVRMDSLGGYSTVSLPAVPPVTLPAPPSPAVRVSSPADSLEGTAMHSATEPPRAMRKRRSVIPVAVGAFVVTLVATVALFSRERRDRDTDSRPAAQGAGIVAEPAAAPPGAAHDRPATNATPTVAPTVETVGDAPRPEPTPARAVAPTVTPRVAPRPAPATPRPAAPAKPAASAAAPAFDPLKQRH